MVLKMETLDIQVLIMSEIDDNELAFVTISKLLQQQWTEYREVCFDESNIISIVFV